MNCPEFIGRKEAIGAGKETAPGVIAPADFWIPKESGVLNPAFERAQDTSGRGSIFSVLSNETTKQMTALALAGILTEEMIGYLLLAALGKITPVIGITLTGASGGAPAKGDNISSAAGGWTATIKKITQEGLTLYYWVEETSGTVDAQTDVTNGVWTDATSAVVLAAGGHFVEVQNDNCHQSFSLYGSNQVGDEVAPGGMMNAFGVEAAIGDYIKFTSEWRAKKVQTPAPQTPAYTDENKFLAKHASVFFADDESGLNAAIAQKLSRFALDIAKNLADTQDLGDVDVNKFNNLNFGLTGSFEGIYRDNTIRDYVTNDSKKASRFLLKNTNAPKLYDAGGDDIYPSVIFDLDKISFNTAEKSDDNDTLVSQTTEFEALPKDGVMIEILVLNTRISPY